jgi:hypothetical protein
MPYLVANLAVLILAALAGWVFVVLTSTAVAAHPPAACVCPDIRTVQADAMAKRDQELAARKLPQDRPTVQKPARPVDPADE